MGGGAIAGSGLIEQYLRELAADLRLPRRARRRVLAEVSDHLTTSADRAGAQAAIRAFGEPRLVARGFSEQLSVAQARRASWATAALTALSCALIALDVPWRSSALGRLYGALAAFAVQIALTCAALSLIRAIRHRHDRALPAGKLRWILRGDAVALGCIAVTAATGVAAVLLSGHPASHTGVLIRSAATIGLSALPLVALVRAQALVNGLAALDDAPPSPGDDALADVTALLGGGTRWAKTLRAHPWWAAGAVAVLAGAALGLGHAITEGGPATLAALFRAGAAFAILLVIEAAVVMACFAVLGGFLGIRRPREGGAQSLSAKPR